MLNTINVSREMPVVPLKKGKIIGVLGTVMLVSVMNSTMFTVAIPEISVYFSLKPSEISWVLTSYIIIFSIGSLVYGKYVDIYPIKNVLTIGLIILGFGSILGFVSPNYSLVIISRIIQACGAASITSLAFVSASRYFPEEKGKVIGIFSSIMALGTGIGPILGGFITGVLSWQYLFLVSSIVWIAVPFIRMWIPTEEKKEGRVDFFGALLIAIVIALIILFITTFSWLWLFTSIFVLAFLVFWILKSKKPFIEPSMFANIRFNIVVLISFLGVFTMFASMFTLTFLLSEVYGLRTIYIGLVIFPGAMLAASVGSYVGKLTDKIGSIPVAYFSFGLLIISFFVFHLSLANLFGS